MEEGEEGRQRLTTDEEEEQKQQQQQQQQQQQHQQRMKQEPGADEHWKSEGSGGTGRRCDCTSKTQLRDLRANVLELITMLVPDFDMGQAGTDIDLNSSKVDDLITEFISGVAAK